MTHRITIPLLASAAALVVATVWLLSKRKKVYVQVARVKKLFIYPVKSLKGVEVQKLEFGNLGVEIQGFLDRSFMLMSGNNVMLSQREEPTLVLLTPSVMGSELNISGGTQPDLKVKIRSNISPDDNIVVCRVHKDFIKVVDCGDDAAQWFSTYLNRTDVRLVQCLPELGTRKIPPIGLNKTKANNGSEIGLQDAGAVHIVSDLSIEELNKKLKENVSELNFRPNVLVEVTEPFQEDDWQFVAFPDGAEVSTVFPCGRCVMTTNNPSTGVKTDKEPLKLLRGFRIPDDLTLAKEMSRSPCFGILCRIEKSGTVQVGDEVFAVVKKGQFKFA